MNWLILILSGLIEIIVTFCLGKASKTIGSERLVWGFSTVCAMALSIYLITKAMRTIPLGTAYAVWTGMGAVGAVLLGILFFKEPATFWRLFFIFTLVASIIGLKFVS
ncbi:multidrug efflux SMR transporter [uncultured Duncaniella sp.]|uniref:DMT family transporter n=1 Tax=uncultured Duncaniella sp. TaxID=2768039 RepID=UPI000A9F904E|nr:multidrug efflux SMR transporter [uncultured Duncaniella sp.]